MFRRHRLLLFFNALLLLLAPACPTAVRRDTPAPARFLWAWERREDLRFLDPREFGVAYFAQLLTLEGGEVRVMPRRQPLLLPDGVYLVAVTRIETAKPAGSRPELSAGQKAQVVEAVLKTLAKPNVRAVQVDFDALASERGFYRELMRELRQKTPDETPLTMTALASWCADDVWLGEFPVAEAVPMVFEMGADAERVRRYLADGRDWNEPLCRQSYGLSVDERVEFARRAGRRVFYFKSRSWEKSDVEKLK